MYLLSRGLSVTILCQGMSIGHQSMLSTIQILDWIFWPLKFFFQNHYWKICYFNVTLTSENIVDNGMEIWYRTNNSFILIFCKTKCLCKNYFGNMYLSLYFFFSFFFFFCVAHLQICRILKSGPFGSWSIWY